MPELPEVETVVRAIRPAITQNKIIAVSVLWHKTASADINNAIGQVVKNVLRRGKYIILQLEQGYLVVHLRMTGKFYATRKIDFNLPEHQKQLRAYFELQDTVLLFQDQRKCGRIIFCQDLDWLEAKLGPEPMSEDFTISALTQICKSNRKIKVLLLDQAQIAGLGNIYVDEVLWYAGVHPEMAAAKVPLSKIKLMHQGIKDILALAINAKGTTFINYTFEGSKKGSFASNLKIFNRTGQKCFRCDTVVTKIKVGQRGTHLCNGCQSI